MLKLALILIVVCIVENKKTRFVFEMFRHGARAPFSGVTKDGYDILGSKWTGDSQLTNMGIRQHYLLGYRNRQRYTDFLSTSFNPNEIYVISSDTPRTIMSANSHLNGMYPPKTGPQLFLNQTNIAVPPVEISDLQEQQNILENNSLLKQVQVFPVHVFSRTAHYYYIHDADV